MGGFPASTAFLVLSGYAIYFGEEKNDDQLITTSY